MHESVHQGTRTLTKGKLACRHCLPLCRGMTPCSLAPRPGLSAQPVLSVVPLRLYPTPSPEAPTSANFRWAQRLNCLQFSLCKLRPNKAGWPGATAVKLQLSLLIHSWFPMQGSCPLPGNSESRVGASNQYSPHSITCSLECWQHHGFYQKL